MRSEEVGEGVARILIALIRSTSLRLAFLVPALQLFGVCKKKDENVENLPNSFTCTIDFSHHCKYYVYNAISLGCLASGGSINCLLDMINDPTETDKRATLIILAGEVRSEEASTVQFS